MPIKYIPYIYFFDENKNFISREKLNIKKETYKINYERFNNPMTVKCDFETTKTQGKFWLLEITIQLGEKYYYPHFCNLTETKTSFTGVDGVRYNTEYKIKNYTFEKLSIEFELSQITTYCSDTDMLSYPKTIDKIISENKDLHKFFL